MVAMPKLDDESYLDFVEGLRKFTIGQMDPILGRQVRDHAAEHPVSSLQDIRDVAEAIDQVQLRNRLLRSTQDMNWNRIVDSYGGMRAELIDELTSAESQGPGRLDFPSGFEYPEYYRTVHYHRQPGGYHDDELAGHIYHYGTKVFHLGGNDMDERKIARANQVPEPADGQIHKVLDFACSIGAMTVAFKQRWPGAEVWGIDAGAPLLRYAHERAVRLGVDVVFSQQLGEDLKFEDGSIDVAYIGTLLHEVPNDVGKAVIAEAHRVVRPGGVVIVNDMLQALDPPDPWDEYDRDFDGRFNGEPYAYKFTHAGFGTLLEETFSSVTVESGRTTMWTCTR